jgi:hypothetical protein
VSGQPQAPVALPPGNERRYPLDKSKGESGRGGHDKKNGSRRESNPPRAASSAVTFLSIRARHFPEYPSSYVPNLTYFNQMHK